MLPFEKGIVCGREEQSCMQSKRGGGEGKVRGLRKVGRREGRLGKGETKKCG